MVGAANVSTGRVAPIVLEPVANGNCLIWRDRESGQITYAVIGKTEVREYLTAVGVPLRLNHFADCPDRERFEREAAQA